jgi:coiled-coil and C2 domain-containing protein 2A
MQSSWVDKTILLPYINQSFDCTRQGASARTTIAEGPNPAWNQQLTLTFKSANNDFSPDTLNRVRDCLYLHLFDEV